MIKNKAEEKLSQDMEKYQEYLDTYVKECEASYEEDNIYLMEEEK